MDHTNKLEQAVLMGQKASEVLNNEAYLDAFKTIHMEIENQWRNSPARDTEGRERLWMMQGLLNKLQSTLESAMQGAAVATLELQHKRKLKERKQSFPE